MQLVVVKYIERVCVSFATHALDIFFFFLIYEETCFTMQTVRYGYFALKI